MYDTPAFVDFLTRVPTPYQFADFASSRLTAAGYVQLHEEEEWSSIPDKCFVIRDDRSLIAFNIGGRDSALIVGTHCDSPCLRIAFGDGTASKGLQTLKIRGGYGGGLWYTYLNRDLRIAGRVFCRDGDRVVSRLFDSEDGIAIIPSKSCGLNTDKVSLSLESDFQIVIGLEKVSLQEYVAEKLGIDKSLIVEWDLSCIDAEEPGIVGDFVASHRIDNQGSTFCALTAFLSADRSSTMNVLAVFDHEEIGSGTRVGARGHILQSVLERVVGHEKMPVLMAKSLVLSCDSAQAFHPNFAGKFDSANAPQLGGGFAIKRSPGTSYASDLTSCAPVTAAAKKLGIKAQVMMNRNDIIGGSTIGPAIAAMLGVPTVDLGQPLLAMHSIRETVAISDVHNMTALLKELYGHFEEYRILL
jgi:aspartyl aminopeptidase